MNQYEAMILFDPTFGASMENCEAEMRRLMQRADAQIVFCKRWDERRLAYRIKGRKRGVYVLAYFMAAPDRIAGLERDVSLSENILRTLIVRADGITPEMMERAVESHGAAAGGEGFSEDSDSGLGDFGDNRNASRSSTRPRAAAVASFRNHGDDEQRPAR